MSGEVAVRRLAPRLAKSDRGTVTAIAIGARLVGHRWLRSI